MKSCMRSVAKGCIGQNPGRVLVWLLVMTIHFIFLDRGSHLDLPPETVYYSPERCAQEGEYIAAWLTQDGTRVEWKCVTQ